MSTSLSPKSTSWLLLWLSSRLLISKSGFLKSTSCEPNISAISGSGVTDLGISLDEEPERLLLRLDLVADTWDSESSLDLPLDSLWDSVPLDVIRMSS